MAVEIERKFKLASDAWKIHISREIVIQQGYLQTGLEAGQCSSVRVRIADEKATLNIKSIEMSIHRTEYEYSIPLTDARYMLENLCEGYLIEKNRYLVPQGEHIWEIDIFRGRNQGLQMAEIELKTMQETFELPDWVGEEVSNNPFFYNNYLIKHPFQYWKE